MFFKTLPSSLRTASPTSVEAGRRRITLTQGVAHQHRAGGGASPTGVSFSSGWAEDLLPGSWIRAGMMGGGLSSITVGSVYR